MYFGKSFLEHDFFFSLLLIAVLATLIGVECTEEGTVETIWLFHTIMEV